MMKKSIMIFAAVLAFALGMTVYGWIDTDSRIGQAALTEETISGNREAAEGLTVGFHAASADNLHWNNQYDFSTGKAKSTFKRAELKAKAETDIYEDIRFTGWSTVPFSTRLNYELLGGLQEKKVQIYYDEIQRRVMDTGKEETGKIRLNDYLDYYPVSFQFHLGTRYYNSDISLQDLKVYDENGKQDSASGAAYDEDLSWYAVFNDFFKIPVIENEYQEYKVSKVKEYDAERALGYETIIEKPLGEGEDYYEFDPVIVLQEENIIDGKKWNHPDLSGGLSNEADDEGVSAAGQAASEYNLKNRLLLAVNNKTVRGEAVDVSEINGGYGIYELPIVTAATGTVRRGAKSSLVFNPYPQMEALQMVYPLDEEAEYVEMSLSGDHRHLAVFSVKDGAYFVEMVDADLWISGGVQKLFPASDKMTYAWGEDGSLAVTDCKGHLAVLSKTGNDKDPYEMLYCGKIGSDFTRIFFDAETATKEHTISRYQSSVDHSLAVTVTEGKAALVQNLPAGDPKYNLRNAALAVAVIDKSGVLYQGRLKSNIVDLAYDMSSEEAKDVQELLGSAAKKHMIIPVGNENWAKW